MVRTSFCLSHVCSVVQHDLHIQHVVKMDFFKQDINYEVVKTQHLKPWV